MTHVPGTMTDASAVLVSKFDFSIACMLELATNANKELFFVPFLSLFQCQAAKPIE